MRLLTIHLLLGFALVTASADTVFARKLVVKLGTVAPQGTAWAKSMEEMGEAFARITNGKVEVRVYAGVVGDEPTILRKMRVGQLHGAVLTSTGLSLIARDPMVLQLPMIFDNFGELDAVRTAIEPDLNQILEKEGFVVLAWGDAGWLHFFTRQPATTPKDIQGTKMWMWAHDSTSLKVFQEVGFSPVVLSSVDMIPSLQTGMIEAVPATAMVALSLQAHALAPHMIDVNWAPVIGATVISKKVWDRIPAEHKKELLAACAKIGAELRAEVRAQSGAAVQAMVDKGLVVHKPTDKQLLLWRKKAEAAHSISRQSAMDAALIDKVLKLRDQARAPKQP